MSGAALALVLTGSLLHVGWNVLAKGAGDKLAFLWLALLPPGSMGVVLLLWEVRDSSIVTTGVVCILASGGVHALYFWFLTSAYAHADLSFVYPYCRGLGALLATVAGVVHFGDDPSLLGYVGVGLTLSAPLFEVPLGKASRAIPHRGWALTLLTGAAIGSYLVIDKIGVEHVAPLDYLGGIMAIPALVLAPTLLLGGRAQRELRRSRHRPFVAAIFLTAAYGVVLAAMQIAPVTYVVAARATGIIASGLAGLLLFREDVGMARWAAIGMVAIGIFCIGVA